MLARTKQRIGEIKRYFLLVSWRLRSTAQTHPHLRETLQDDATFANFFFFCECSRSAVHFLSDVAFLLCVRGAQRPPSVTHKTDLELYLHP